VTARFLVYGANGYTGELIAREAVRRGLAPVLAGRNAEAVQQLAASLGLEGRVAGLADGAVLRGALRGVGAVLHCAGPFSATAQPMMRACLDEGVHYLDVTGEYDVLEAAHALDAAAMQAGIVLCPGVGFDVVPTDCVAAALKQALPDATYLALGFDSRSGVSHGTARSTIEGLAKGGRIRSAGRLVTVAHAFRDREIDYGDGPKASVTIPWGDVSTAYFTTGIPNIEFYVPMPPRRIAALRRLNAFLPLLRLRAVQALLKGRVSKSGTGPDQSERIRTSTYVWGEAQAPSGEMRTARIVLGNLYDVTVHAALGVLAKVLEQPRPGYCTPSQVVGSGYVEELPGAGRLSITSGRAWEPRPS
jgi:short subunit dehydrogenase-like uncharacterized protein